MFLVGQGLIGELAVCMQALVAAMAATAMTMSTLSTSLAAPTVAASQSAFQGAAVRVSHMPMLAMAKSRSLIITAATKKAVAVLKGNASVEGVVTLLQEDDGQCCGFYGYSHFTSILFLWHISGVIQLYHKRMYHVCVSIRVIVQCGIGLEGTLIILVK